MAWSQPAARQDLTEIVSGLEQHRARMDNLLDRLDGLRDTSDRDTAAVLDRFSDLLRDREQALQPLVARLATGRRRPSR
jgi:hypothetical protein